MIRLILFSLLLSLPAGALFAQKHTEEFVLPHPEEKIAGSLYSNLQLLDLRPDTSDAGTIRAGAFNRLTRLVPQPALSLQLPEALKKMTDAGTAQPGSLLLLLRHFRISELTIGLTETGYCPLQADLLVSTNGQYQMLARIDTLLEVRGGLDITKVTLKKSGGALLHFIASNLTKSPAGSPVLTWAAVLHLDSVEKRNIPLYNLTNGYTDGLYESYETFALQRPSIQVTATVGNGTLYKARTFYPAGRKGDRVKPGSAYALVYKGIPYIGTDYGFYRLHKKEDDFLFTGSIKVNPENSADLFVASLAFGLIGAVVVGTAADNTKIYNFKISHRNGRPVLIPPATTKTYILDGATDSLLKAALPVFKTDNLAEGLYRNWESFAAQIPDHQIKAQVGNGIVMNVKSVGEGNTQRFSAGDMYALVHNHTPYVVTQGTYYKLRKEGTDWIFNAHASVIDLTAKNKTASYEVRINPADGSFEMMREVN